MSHLTVPIDTRPALVTLASFEDDLQLAVYDGYPDSQPWAAEATARAQVSSNPHELKSILDLSGQEMGAPFGPFTAESYRVARAVGVLTRPERHAHPVPAQELKGVAVSQGLVCATWRNTEIGCFLVVQFHAPHAFGWGEGRASLCQEHLKARCLHQYAHQAKSLLELTAGCERAQSLLTEFIGDWGAETDNIRRGLATTCILYWSAVAAQEDDEHDFSYEAPALLAA